MCFIQIEVAPFRLSMLIYLKAKFVKTEYRVEYNSPILAGRYLLQPEVSLDKQVFNMPLSESLAVVGYRNNTGNATTGFRYYFYVQRQDHDLPKPFLITDTPTVHFIPKSSNSFTLTVKGKVYQFTNMIWIKTDNKLIPISVEFKAERVNDQNIE